MQKILHVSDNPEHFSSIGSALAQIPANNTTPVIIEIAPGIYHEKLTINKPYITREFDTLKSKKVPQSLEIGLFFCQIFIFII